MAARRLGRYTVGMSSHSIAEAQERLPELIDRALRGEPVVITRDGRPVLELRPVGGKDDHWRTPAESVDWLDRHRVGHLSPGAPDAGELVSRMRDEEWD